MKKIDSDECPENKSMAIGLGSRGRAPRFRRVLVHMAMIMDSHEW